VPTDQQQFLAYWTAETGWSTEVHLRNNQKSGALAVTPVLRTPDGTETPLAAVTVQPQEVGVIDLDAAITAAGATQLLESWGSVVLRYRAVHYANLYAAEMIHRNGHAIAIHIDGLGQNPNFQAGGREGIWWLPKDSTSDYLILSNQGDNPIPLDLSLFDAAGNVQKQSVLLGPRATNRYSVRQLRTAAGLSGGSYGGIKVSASANAGSLNTFHFLFDETANFSAILKMFDYDPAAQLQARDYAKTGVWTLRAPMLALASPDAALGFPAGTVLQPQLLIRNTTGKVVSATLRFNWRNDTTTGKAAGPALRLNAFETRRVDIAALQDGKTLPPDARWTSITLTTNSNPEEVVAVAASYDSTMAYGAQTPFSDQLTFRWEGGQWEVDALHDSIITVGNGGADATRAAFTLFYNQGTARYDLEQTLQPDEQMWIDVGKLISGHVPDKNGNVLPDGLATGSYEARDLTHRGAGTLFEGKVIYDKTYGHAAYGCALCCGAGDAYLFFDPLGILMGSPADQYVYALDECQAGDPNDFSDSFYGNWTVNDTSVATADYYGTHSAVSVGSTRSNTHGLINNNDTHRLCPLQGFYPSGGDNSMPSVSFSPIPYILVGQTATTTATVDPPKNSTPISLYTSGPASVVSPTGTFTANTSVLVKGLSVGTGSLNASVYNSDGSYAVVGSTAFLVGALGSFQFTLLSTPIPGEGNSVISGQSAQVQVQAFDYLGNQFSAYQGTVHFSSTDTMAALPADYTFVPADAGSHVFNVTLKTVVGTGPQRDLTVKDTASGISATQNIYIWWQVNMDVEFWKECNFVQCPELGSYYCATSYNSSGYGQKTAFLAITASSSTLANQSIKVRNGSQSQVAFIGDAGPILNYPYWNNGAAPPTVAGCLSDLLATNVGISNGCNGSTGYGGGVILWRFGN
jgi:hypothetical protein